MGVSVFLYKFVSAYNVSVVELFVLGKRINLRHGITRGAGAAQVRNGNKENTSAGAPNGRRSPFLTSARRLVLQGATRGRGICSWGATALSALGNGGGTKHWSPKRLTSCGRAFVTSLRGGGDKRLGESGRSGALRNACADANESFCPYSAF